MPDQYYIVEGGRQTAQSDMDQASADGWELVTFHSHLEDDEITGPGVYFVALFQKAGS